MFVQNCCELQSQEMMKTSDMETKAYIKLTE